MIIDLTKARADYAEQVRRLEAEHAAKMAAPEPPPARHKKRQGQHRPKKARNL